MSACIHCGTAAATVALALDRRALIRCTHCQLVRLDPVPTPAELSAVYDSGHYYTTEPPSLRSGLGARLQDLVRDYPKALPPLARVAASIALRPLRARFLPVPFPGDAPVLDIGCGNGQRLLELERYGCSALFGLEPTVGAAEQARRARTSALPFSTPPTCRAGISGSSSSTRCWSTFRRRRTRWPRSTRTFAPAARCT